MPGCAARYKTADAAGRAGALSDDLAVLLLREHLTGVLGDDPLSAEGMARWGRELLAIYATGLLAAPAGGEEGNDEPGRAGGTGRK